VEVDRWSRYPHRFKLISKHGIVQRPKLMQRTAHTNAPDGAREIRLNTRRSGSEGPLSLSAVGSSFATLAKFDPASEKQRWILKIP